MRRLRFKLGYVVGYVFFSWLLAACAHDGTQVPLRVLDTREKPGLGVVKDACEFWTLECFTTRKPYGSITLILTDRGADINGSDLEINGLSTHDDSCNPVLFSRGHTLTIAHELGNALGGLKDVADSDNVMCDAEMNTLCQVPGSQRSEDQKDAVTAGAAAFSICRGGA